MENDSLFENFETSENGDKECMKNEQNLMKKIRLNVNESKGPNAEVLTTSSNFDIKTDDICLLDKMRLDYGRIMFNKLNSKFPVGNDIICENSFLINNDPLFKQNNNLKEFANLKNMKRKQKILRNWIAKQNSYSPSERKRELYNLSLSAGPYKSKGNRYC